MSQAVPTAQTALGGDRALAIRTVGATFAVLALVEAALLHDSSAGPYWVLLLSPGYALLYAGAGLLAWWRRPENGFGALVVFCGLLLLLAGLLNLGPERPALILTGLVLASTPLAGVMHLLLTFPSGRLTGRIDRALVVAVWTVAVVLQAPRYLFVDLPAPYDTFHLVTEPDLARAGTWTQNILGCALLAAAAFVTSRRLRDADRAQRRTLGLVAVVGIVTVLFIPLSTHLAPQLSVSPVSLFVAQMTALGLVPVAFVLAALRGGFARTSTLAELGMHLGAGDRSSVGLRNGLAAALGDPSLELLQVTADGTGFLGSDGQPVPAPRATGTRGTVGVQLDGRSVGVISYDAAMLPNPDVVRAAGRVLALALDRERLAAELASSREAVRESRARIVAAADRERRRVERNLHDGAQQRLTGLALLLRLAGDRAGGTPAVAELLADADRELESAIAELRVLGRGLHPAILTDVGLAAALESLAERSAVPVLVQACPAERLPEQVEVTAYYVVAEALANAAKHSGATLVTVFAERREGMVHVEICDDGAGGAQAYPGSGLEGLRDRVEAVRGRLQLDSAAGGGTRLKAELPCG
jgi:signal transduction histidine kinase